MVKRDGISPIRTKTTSTRTFLRCFNRFCYDSAIIAEAYFFVGDKLLEVQVKTLKLSLVGTIRPVDNWMLAETMNGPEPPLHPTIRFLFVFKPS